MPGYLLNLIYSKPGAATSAHGLFLDDNPSAPERSKVWYSMGAAWPAVVPPKQDHQVMEVANLPLKVPPQPIPENPLPGQKGFGCSLGDDIYVRMAADASWGRLWPMWSDGLKMSLEYSAVFGRPNTSDHGGAIMASPFVFLEPERGSGFHSPRSVFSLRATTPGPDGSFIFYLGRLAQNAIGQKGKGDPHHPTRLSTYSFNVGANVYFTENGVEHQFAWGHDPQMGVTG
jgi:hypothetical protein